MQLNSNEIEIIEKSLRNRKTDLTGLKCSYENMILEELEDRLDVDFANNRITELNNRIDTINGLLEKLKDEVI